MVRNDYFPVRPEIVIDQLKALDLFPSIAAPLVKASGEVIEDSIYAIPSYLIISFTNPNNTGVLYYTLDGSDPRLLGGTISPDAMVYSNTVNETALISLNSNWDDFA